MLDHLATLGQAQQRRAVDALGVEQHARAVDNRRRLLLALLDLVRSQVAVGAARLRVCVCLNNKTITFSTQTTTHTSLLLSHLNFERLCRINAQLALNACDVGAHALRGHAEQVVRNAAVDDRLARRERLPVLVAEADGKRWK